jgi:hypothetical protein
MRLGLCEYLINVAWVMVSYVMICFGGGIAILMTLISVYAEPHWSVVMTGATVAMVGVLLLLRWFGR